MHAHTHGHTHIYTHENGPSGNSAKQACSFGQKKKKKKKKRKKERSMSMFWVTCTGNGNHVLGTELVTRERQYSSESFTGELRCSNRPYFFLKKQRNKDNNNNNKNSIFVCLLHTHTHTHTHTHSHTHTCTHTHILSLSLQASCPGRVKKPSKSPAPQLCAKTACLWQHMLASVRVLGWF